ncbi:hypothetical protein RIF29_20429 [Crotalaria pallida]|uniref:AMP-activated protein kinase glycogen-binding domain-containing protein n=1 Tax=Crotalaria pallida TaxID=3830 RepID=A0AAN9F5L0_CROPI
MIKETTLISRNTSHSPHFSLLTSHPSLFISISISISISSIVTPYADVNMSTTLCYFPSSTTITRVLSRKLSLTHHHHLLLQPTTSLTPFHLRASLTNNTSTTTRKRRSRKLKSDAEICKDICQFLDSVGLPEDHIPSTKELLQHGWKDLANIVRRRGHKQIKELLTSSLNANIDSLNRENSLDERLDADDDRDGVWTGQNVKMDSLVGDVTASIEVLLGNNSSSSDTDSTISLDEHTSFPVEPLANLSMDNGEHNEEVSQVPIEGTVVDNDFSTTSEILYPNFDNQNSIPTEISGESSFETKASGNLECEGSVGELVGEVVVPSVENHSNTSFNDSDLDNEHKVFSPLQSSMESSLEHKDWHALEGLDDSNNNILEDVPSTSEASVMENLFGDSKNDLLAHSADNSPVTIDSSANLALVEKVANFIQNGDLDLLEDHVSGISNGDDSQESEVYMESEPVVDMSLNAHPPEDSESLFTSKQVIPFGMLDQVLVEDDHIQHEDLTAHFDKNFNAEHQKELELSRLKEQIEKEKLALSVLQTKAEAEISKARKLVSEKDAELDVAEESLSGLKEVQIEFWGEGDVVEVAGSFNGWHHPIKMDPHPSTSAIDIGGSRRSRFWSTMLWLYPGVYEIKFVVDGHWRIDPQKESVQRGHINNNILRVDR